MTHQLYQAWARQQRFLCIFITGVIEQKTVLAMGQPTQFTQNTIATRFKSNGKANNISL